MTTFPVPRHFLKAAFCALLACGLWLAWLWQPHRQVALHQRSLLHALEQRDWKEIGSLISHSYRDRWGYDKAFVLGEMPQVFRQFLWLKVTAEERRCETAGSAGYWEGSLRLAGQGGPFAKAAIARVNSISGPWTFHWAKSGRWPWDWQLVAVANEELETLQWE